MLQAQILSLMHFLAAIIYVFLAIRIFNMDRSAAMNRTAVLLLICFTMWSLGLTVLSMPEMPPAVIQAVWRIYPAGWITFPVFMILLFMIMSEKKALYSSRILKIVLAVFPVFFFILHVNGLLMKDPVLGPYGWYPSWRGNLWDILFKIYYISLSLIGVVMMFGYFRQVKSPILKKMSLAALTGSILTMTLGSAVEFVLPAVFKEQTFFSQIADIMVLLWAFSIIYAISAYGFFKVTPASAADKIIADMNELLILLNEELQIQYANKHALKFLGYEESGLVGRDFNALFARSDDFNNVVKAVLKTGACSYPEMRILKKDRSTAPVIFSASMLREMNDMVGVVCVASDISEMKKAQEELQESYDKLKELDNLKSNFVSMVSHELRTPLASIKGFTQLLLKGVDTKPGPQQQEFLELIQNNSNRLLSIINNLLDMSKLEFGNFKLEYRPSELEPLITRCIEELKPISAPKKVSIDAKLSGEGAVLSLDPDKIYQSLINLMGNAIKFSRENSGIEVGLGIFDSGDIAVPAHAKNIVPGRYCVITVRDHGEGIPADKLEKIFEKFYQVENTATRNKAGTGLGLTIVRSIVEMHKGYVWAESEGREKGAKFTVVLPA